MKPLHNRNYSIDFDGTRGEENRLKLEADRENFYKRKSRKHVKAFIEETDKLTSFRVSVPINISIVTDMNFVLANARQARRYTRRTRLRDEENRGLR